MDQKTPISKNLQEKTKDYPPKKRTKEQENTKDYSPQQNIQKYSKNFFINPKIIYQDPIKSKQQQQQQDTKDYLQQNMKKQQQQQQDTKDYLQQNVKKQQQQQQQQDTKDFYINPSEITYQNSINKLKLDKSLCQDDINKFIEDFNQDNPDTKIDIENKKFKNLLKIINNIINKIEESNSRHDKVCLADDGKMKFVINRQNNHLFLKIKESKSKSELKTINEKLDKKELEKINTYLENLQVQQQIEQFNNSTEVDFKISYLETNNVSLHFHKTINDNGSEVIKVMIIGQKLGEGSYGVVKQIFDHEVIYDSQKGFQIKKDGIIRARKSIKNPNLNSKEISLLEKIEPSITHYHRIDQGNNSKEKDSIEKKLYINMPFYKKEDDINQYLNNEKNLMEFFLKCALVVSKLKEENIIHGDLKIDNMVFHKDPQTNKLVVNIVDFGTAHSINSSRYPSGTETTMAPEIANKKGEKYDVTDIDFKGDVYSLGVVFATLLFGYCREEFLYDKITSKISFNDFNKNNFLNNILGMVEQLNPKKSSNCNSFKAEYPEIDMENTLYKELKEKYSKYYEKFISLLTNMLKENPKERYGIEEVVLSLHKMLRIDIQNDINMQNNKKSKSKYDDCKICNKHNDYNKSNNK